MAKQCCEDVREILVAFLDDELPSDVSHEMQEHLDQCGPCQSYARFEESFTDSLRARLQRVPAPDSLAARVRARIDDADRAPSPRYSARWIGLAAAAAILLMLLPAAPAIKDAWLQRGASDHGDVTAVSGILVCFECEKHGATIEAQRNCREHGHQTGLRCPRIGLWHLVANETTAILMDDPGLRGRHVTLQARRFDAIRYLDVQAVSFSSGT